MNKLLRVAAVGILGMSLAGCGSEKAGTSTGTATLEVASLPNAEVSIDGSTRGTTPLVVDRLSPGKHELVLKQNGFVEQRETIELKSGETKTLDAISLVPSNPDDPATLALLAQPFEVTIEPFAMPERHRGASDITVLLLWPRDEVRLVGLQTYAIEVGDAYEGGRLEFRKGKDVLWSERFDPANNVTVGAIPPEVLEAAKEKASFTWGIVFDDKKAKPFTTDFTISTGARAEKAEKQIQKIRDDRRLAKEPPIVRDLLEANALSNYRFYSESLVKGLDIAQKYPTSIRPFEGIVTSMVRLDLKDSSLYAAVMPFVDGKGQANARAGLAGGAASVSDARIEAIARYLPPMPAQLPTIASNGASTGSGALHAGGSVPVGPQPATSAPGSLGSGSPGAPGVTAPGVSALQQHAADVAQRLGLAEQRERDLRNGVDDRTREIAGLRANQAQLEQRQQQANSDLATAQAAFDAALANPATTPEQLEAAGDAVRAAQQTVDSLVQELTNTTNAIGAAQAQLDTMRAQLGEASAAVDALRTEQTALQQQLGVSGGPSVAGSPGGVPVVPGTGAPDPLTNRIEAANVAVQDAERALRTAQDNIGAQEQAVQAAQAAFDASGTPENHQALLAAQAALTAAHTQFEQAQQQLAAAQTALQNAVTGTIPPEVVK